MFFNRLFISFVFIASIQSVFAQSSLQTRTLGILIQDQLFENFFRFISQKERSFNISHCLENRLIRGTLKVDVDRPQWKQSPAKSQQNLLLETTLHRLSFEGILSHDCQDPKPSTETYQVQLVDQRVGLWLDGSQLEVEFERSTLRYEENRLSLSIGNAMASEEILSEIEKEAIFEETLKFLERYLSSYVQDFIQSFQIVRTLEQIVGASSFWNKGLEIDTGSIRLRNTGATTAQKQVAFVLFHPFRSDREQKEARVFFRQNQIQLLFESTFMDSEQVRQLSALPQDIDFESHLRSLSTRLNREGVTLLSRLESPRTPSFEGEIAFLLPNILINDALRAIYLEGLLRFSTHIELGEQTRGLLYNQAPRVESRVQINPQSAPRIDFNPDRLEVAVTNYSLDLGTWIEDRLIPSERLQASVKMGAQVVLNEENQTINLRIDPKSFRIQLESMLNQMGSREIEIIEGLSNQVWNRFFSEIPELVLLPSFIRNSIVPLKITGIDFRAEEHTLIKMKVDYEAWK